MLLLLSATGDIDEMWIRDSAVQVAIYLPAARRDPAMRSILEGVIFRQAFFILQVSSCARCDRRLLPRILVVAECKPHAAAPTMPGPLGELVHAASHAGSGVEQQAAPRPRCDLFAVL